jgi:hypothetical protein
LRIIGIQLIFLQILFLQNTFAQNSNFRKSISGYGGIGIPVSWKNAEGSRIHFKHGGCFGLGFEIPLGSSWHLILTACYQGFQPNQEKIQDTFTADSQGRSQVEEIEGHQSVYQSSLAVKYNLVKSIESMGCYVKLGCGYSFFTKQTFQLQINQLGYHYEYDEKLSASQRIHLISGFGWEYHLADSFYWFFEGSGNFLMNLKNQTLFIVFISGLRIQL